MLTAELSKKIDTLPFDEYQMVEVYVNSILEYSKRKKKEVAWGKIKIELNQSEERLRAKGGISSEPLRKNLGVL